MLIFGLAVSQSTKTPILSFGGVSIHKKGKFLGLAVCQFAKKTDF